MGIRFGVFVCALFAGCAGSPQNEPPRAATVPIAAPAADGGDGSSIDAGAQGKQARPPPRAPDASVTPDASTPATEAGSPGAVRAGCMRLRKSYQYRCSGMAPRPGEPNGYPVTVCDRCLTDADCKAKPGGRCSHVGGPCMGPPHLECKYPSARCGGHICPEPAPQMPPSMPPR